MTAIRDYSHNYAHLEEQGRDFDPDEFNLREAQRRVDQAPTVKQEREGTP
jgi:hypothetical protein